MAKPIDPRALLEFGDSPSDRGQESHDQGSCEFGSHVAAPVVDPPDGARGRAVSQGARIDRYLLTARLECDTGELAYTAIDEKRLRSVLIRVFGTGIGHTQWASAGRRATSVALKTALAIAKLTHMELIPLLDVGLFDDRVYVVLAPVDGQSMQEWLRAANRACRDIVQLLESGLPEAQRELSGLSETDDGATGAWSPPWPSTTDTDGPVPHASPVWNLCMRPIYDERHDDMRQLSAANEVQPIKVEYRPLPSALVSRGASGPALRAGIEHASSLTPTRDRGQALQELYLRRRRRTRSWTPGLPCLEHPRRRN